MVNYEVPITIVESYCPSNLLSTEISSTKHAVSKFCVKSAYPFKAKIPLEYQKLS